MSEEGRKRLSDRMKQNNPSRNPANLQKMVQTRRERYGDYFADLTRQRAESGEFQRKRPMSAEERAAISKRMHENNPMKRQDVVAKVQSTRERTGANQRTSERNREQWASGKFQPQHHKRGINKLEAKLLTVIAPLGFRYVGDGSFWLNPTPSGICRNPDYVYQSGRRKIALLLNSVYYHTVRADPELELQDYRTKGWSVFVLWLSAKGQHLPDYMLPTIVVEVAMWLAGLQSKKLKRPDIHQFSTSNALLTITSSHPG